MLSDEEIRTYFENRAVCIRAAGSLRESASIGLEVISSAGMTRYFRFSRKNGGNQLVSLDSQSTSDDDFTFFAPEQTLKEVLQTATDDIAEIGVLVFKRMMRITPEENRIRVQMRIGLLGVTRKGYLGIIAQGGRSIASFLASHGFSLTSIRSWMEKVQH